MKVKLPRLSILRREESVRPTVLETILPLGSIGAAMGLGLDYHLHRNGPIRYRNANTFAAFPPERMIARMPYSIAKKKYGLTHTEYQAILEHEKQHVRDVGRYIAYSALPSLAIGPVSYFARRYLHVSKGVGLAAGILSAFMLGALGMANLESRADKAAGRKYKQHMISGLQKLYKAHPDWIEIPAPFESHGTLKQRIKRIRGQY